jgi:protein-tyrosine phosphatase
VLFAQSQKQLGRPVLVHCAHGHGRSTVVLCAFMVAEGMAPTFLDALAMVKTKRPKAKLNPRQVAALVEWTRRRERGTSR